MSLLSILGCAALAITATDPLDDVFSEEDFEDGVDALRDKGPAGLDEILAARDRAPDEETWRRAVDAVAAQRGAHRSELFWHTDLDEALQRAEAEDKKVLSLKLLGNLSDEYSCANSRLFRTVLYTHPGVRAELDENWVLHWSSERPAPHVTIDMGDGRSLTRTITGNSIHYALDAEGHPIDAFPGLWAPEPFVAALVGARNDEPVASPKPAITRQALASVVPRSTSAEVPMAMTMGKMMIEQPMLDGMGFGEATPEPIDPSVWRREASSIQLHQEALDVLAEENPEVDLGPMVLQLQSDIAADSIRNEVWLRPQILRSMGEFEDLESLNRWVYDEVFLTPADDPWLGLVNDSVYTGLDGGGVRG